jgi:MoxR-like ATPase
MKQLDHIWLSPACEDERTWSIERHDCEDCDEKAVKYVRAEVSDAEIERMRAAIRWALGEGTDECGLWFGESVDDAIEANRRPYWWRRHLRKLAALEQRGTDDKNKLLRATLLNIQSLAESGFPLNNAKIAAQCRHALDPHRQNEANSAPIDEIVSKSIVG